MVEPAAGARVRVRPEGGPDPSAPALADGRPAQGGSAAGPNPERTLVLLATDGVSYLVHWLVILILFSQAVTSVLRPPGGSVAVGLVAGLVCLLWSAFCLGMGILRGTRPDGADLPPPVWLSAVASAGCLVSLFLVRAETGQPGPWSAELGAAALLVASVTVWRGEWLGGSLGLVLGVGVLVGPALLDPSGQSTGTALADVIAGGALIAAGFVVALALRWVRRSARRLQESLDARDELLVRERSVRAASQVAAEVERSLHDTALNTLETIAAHGQHLAPETVVARCRSDVERLSQWRSETGVRDFAEALSRLDRHAENLGLDLEIDRVGPPPGSNAAVVVPPPVLHAITGAASEALTNVAKHAGVRRATILVVSNQASIQVLVRDEGVGVRAPAGGYGVVASVAERMAAVGGTSLVTAGPGGRGTVVALGWQPEPDEIPDIGGDLLLRIAGVVVSVATLLAGVACALVVLDWPTYAQPWVALAAPVLPVLIAAWLLNRSRSGVAVGPAQLLVVCAAYATAAAGAVLADPTCSSALGEGVFLDSRAMLVVVVMILAPQASVLVTLTGTIVITHAVAALAWNAQWGDCGQETAVTGVYVIAALGAVWLFARWIDRASAAYGAARADATDTEVRIQSQISVRAEEELWVADTLASAQALLGAVADGRLQPTDAATRDECATEASFLRALLAVGRAPERLRRSARIWLRLLHSAGCPVQVRGAFGGCAPQAAVVGRVGGVLDTVCSMAPGAAVTLSSWADPTRCSLMVTASGPAVARSADALAARVDRVAGPVAWREVGSDSITVEWAWPSAEMTESAAPSR
jgi:signal transduction histidine kinase